MEPRVLRYDDRGGGEAIVLVPGGLTGWLSWMPHQERLGLLPDDPGAAHPQ